MRLNLCVVLLKKDVNTCLVKLYILSKTALGSNGLH